MSLFDLLYILDLPTKELFNLCHASLWNVIECIFGVCKRCFKLMTAAPEYSLWTQAKIPLALSALHNFIHIHDPTDEATTTHDYLAGTPHAHSEIEIDPDQLGTHISQEEKD